MKLYSIHDPEFASYGMPLPGGYDFSRFISILNAITEAPSDKVIYVPDDKRLSSAIPGLDLRDRLFGGLDIQVGYCNGSNTKLNCLECHRGLEVLVAADDVILLLAHKSEMVDNRLNTDAVKAFYVPKGEAVLYYETTMHYAPCRVDGPFRTAIILFKGTNTEKPRITEKNSEDQILFARNKWLIAHPDAPEVNDGAVIGLDGKNLDVLIDLD
ncbi:DUF4867 family protein [Bifidobacterium felsineum]|uniref:DUF4867 domain-containing protein n=1 Tax=Bifidobacterium felsineum TaxID=2045440 RepID=A0A2M9HKD1_9BIFI|nr:DUF4867 family protein [Bifidobacterium felsineum]PJM77272.1 DUF4867 domain-containing protein [Bifidobacterium felsineum]